MFGPIYRPLEGPLEGPLENATKFREGLRIMVYTYCYDEARKATAAKRYRATLRKVVNLLGLAKGQYDLRFNSGGIAVWGEVTLHTDRVYVQMSHDRDTLIRTCKGRKDYTGGPNRWLQHDRSTPENIAAFVRSITE